MSVLKEYIVKHNVPVKLVEYESSEDDAEAANAK